MSIRTFRDRGGRGWQVKVRAKREWLLEPQRGNPASARVAVPPLYADDPFELSEQELWKILDGARAVATPGRRSPFGDDAEPGGPPRSPFK